MLASSSYYLCCKTDVAKAYAVAVFKATNVFILPQRYILKRWTKSAKDEAILDEFSSVDNQNNSQKGKYLQYNILYQEAIKCAEEGMASDHIFKVALSALREAKIISTCPIQIF